MAASFFNSPQGNGHNFETNSVKMLKAIKAANVSADRAEQASAHQFHTHVGNSGEQTRAKTTQDAFDSVKAMINEQDKLIERISASVETAVARTTNKLHTGLHVIHAENETSDKYLEDSTSLRDPNPNTLFGHRTIEPNTSSNKGLENNDSKVDSPKFGQS